MKPDFSGDYITAKSIHDGDIVEFIDEGKVVFNDFLNKDMFELKVKTNEKVKTWSPSDKHGVILQKAFGDDTKGWIGKKVQLSLLEGKMFIKPLV